MPGPSRDAPGRSREPAGIRQAGGRDPTGGIPADEPPDPGPIAGGWAGSQGTRGRGPPEGGLRRYRLAAVRLSDFDYQLPPEAIAQQPIEPRDAARLLCHRRSDGRRLHRQVRDLPDLLAPGDLLVLNDTRVIPARLFAQRPGGGRVELLLCRRLPGAGGTQAPVRYSAMARPAAKLAPGMALRCGEQVLRVLCRELEPDGSPAPFFELEFEGLAPADEAAQLARLGRLPLPPYIQRPGGPDPVDEQRYQTVYARVPGAVAAPTAGLHLTPELFERLEQRGVERAFVTLHVGPGTFRPVESEDPRQHRMHAEEFVLSAATAEAIRRTRARGGRVCAVGTTVVRTLESAADGAGGVRAGAGETRLFLAPGDRFQVVDALLTNFHLPKSTLLMLVAAFIGTAEVLSLYAEALREGYRFYSYGDATWLE